MLEINWLIIGCTFLGIWILQILARTLSFKITPSYLLWIIVEPLCNFYYYIGSNVYKCYNWFIDSIDYMLPIYAFLDIIMPLIHILPIDFCRGLFNQAWNIKIYNYTMSNISDIFKYIFDDIYISPLLIPPLFAFFIYALLWVLLMTPVIIKSFVKE